MYISTAQVLKNIRRLIYFSAGLITISLFLLSLQFGSENLRIIRLAQYYAFVSFIFLYLTLLASPLYFVFPNLKTKNYHIFGRRALGLSTFFFALLHSIIAFFFSLNGFEGLPFLSWEYLLPILISFVALIFLAILASTAFDLAERRLGKWWKRLHRIVYVAGILIIVHVVLIGTHYQNLGDFIPYVSFILISFLLILESIRIDGFIRSKLINYPKFGITFFIVATAIIFGGFKLATSATVSPFSLHHNKVEQTDD